MKKSTSPWVALAIGVWLGLAPVFPVAAADGAGAGAADPVERRAETYAALMRAALAQRRGEFRSAAAEIRRAVDLAPEEPAVLHEGAVLLERMGRSREAEELARRALERAPDDPDIVHLVADFVSARVLADENPPAELRSEALALYDRFLALGGVDADALRRMANLKMQAGDRVGAIAVARRLVERWPGDRRAAGLLAQLLLDEGQPLEGLTVVLGYLASHPDDAPLLRLAEDLTRQLDAWDRVADAFVAGIPSIDGAEDARRLHGEALLRLDRPAAAADVLARVLRDDPADAAVRFHLARTYREIGRLGDALPLVRELLEERADDRPALLLLAEILDAQSADDEAIDVFQRLLAAIDGAESGPEAELADAVRRRIAAIELGKGRTGEALAVLDRMVDPNDGEGLELRARAAIEAKDWEGARQVARRLRAASHAGPASLIEAEVLLRSGKESRAGAKVEEAIGALGPWARVRAAETLLELERSAEGAALLEAWVAASPEDPAARYQLGSYYYRTGRSGQGERELREALRIDPKHAPALNFLGYSLAERGERLDEALDLVERALAEDAWNGAYLDSLGWIYFQMGRLTEARPPLEAAARSFPRDPVVLDHLGDLYLKLGEPARAVEVWRRAVDAGAADRPALEAKIEIARAAIVPPTARRVDEPAAGETTEPPHTP